MQYSFVAALAMAVLPLVTAELSWEEAYVKARAAVAKITTSDKVGIVTGVGWNKGPCVGNTYPVASIGYPTLCLQDGPLGVRYASSVTAFTPSVHASSTWDKDLIRQRAQFHAEEAKALGVHVLLGPVAGAIGKIAEGGRNWEGWGSDPYLNGLNSAISIKAMQAAGVQATLKHYVANEQELNRDSMSSNVDDRTMHEIYLWPYAEAVHAGVAAVMCSYNKLDGTWACENDHYLNGLLKEELAFPGYIMTDWGAQHSTVESANTGLDMSMPGSAWAGDNVYWGDNLSRAIQSGQVSEERVGDMATRILAAWYKTGQDAGFPSIDLTRDVKANHADNVRAVARDGTILLKNEGGILPLSGPLSIAVVGSGAVKGDHANNVCEDKACNNGALGMGWGSGTVKYPYFIAPYDAIKGRADKEGAAVTLSGTDEPDAGARAASGKDVALVFLTSDAGEGYLTVEGHLGDRNHLEPWHNGAELVRAVAAVSENVIIVVHSVGPVTLSPLLELPSVKGVVWAGLPSQESGNALADVVWGDVSPSGKLVYTIAKNAADYNTKVVNGDDNFSEGLLVDYRHFDDAGIEPEFEFGFGLSYTNFSYSDITIDSQLSSGPATGPVIPGGHADLFEEVATVTATITNSGGVAGAEVAQLYVSFPDSAGTPPRQLRGYDKLPLQAGASGVATFSLLRRDLSVWDTAAQVWTVPAGKFVVSVGASSRDIRLEGTIQAA
ncbi:unnamed protein product [Clonostachys chloroleuca]|uniref:Beta-glucosidase cel3A n=1 Tax=Clonostachys chloroleuca TaxID=1926264 RepID=A0AA35M7E6_9HYPO|nr:unnamed protein product [Clonostachys chloroleuca]